LLISSIAGKTTELIPAVSQFFKLQDFIYTQKYWWSIKIRKFRLALRQQNV
jgi:hypothetical protein